MRRELSLTVDCPKCGAEAGSPCLGRRGPRRSMHQERAAEVSIDSALRARPAPYGYIYFIRCSKTELVKIGFTEAYPTKRLRELQTGSGGRLHLLAFIMDRASREKELHRQFVAQHERGEWFRNEGELAEWIREMDL